MKARIAFIFAMLGMMSLPVVAGSITVYVGYADNLRASGFFPNPWLTAPGVFSETPGGQSLDTGAIRVDNNTGASITISGMTVTFNAGAHVFNFWAPLVIPNGGIGIFTQTFSYNFDTSDFGLFGGGPVNVDATHPLGGCTNPQGATEVANCIAYEPQVAFNMNGSPLSYTDTGHILDTFGYDLINLGPPGGDGNESINWNVIGSTPTRGGSVPEPSTILLVAPALAGIGLLRRRFNRG